MEGGRKGGRKEERRRRKRRRGEERRIDGLCKLGEHPKGDRKSCELLLGGDCGKR